MAMSLIYPFHTHNIHTECENSNKYTNVNQVCLENNKRPTAVIFISLSQ